MRENAAAFQQARSRGNTDRGTRGQKKMCERNQRTWCSLLHIFSSDKRSLRYDFGTSSILPCSPGALREALCAPMPPGF